MIFKYSLKGLMRTPFRTILFLILLAVVTSLMILGTNMKLTSENLLKEADEKFDTVATLEYMGKNYPDVSLYDATLVNLIEKYDFEKLNDAPYVLSYEPALNIRGTIADFTMKALAKPYKDFSIIQFQVIRINEEENYASCMLLKTYYAYEPRVDGLIFRLQNLQDVMYWV